MVVRNVYYTPSPNAVGFGAKPKSWSNGTTTTQRRNMGTKARPVSFFGENVVRSQRSSCSHAKAESTRRAKALQLPQAMYVSSGHWETVKRTRERTNSGQKSKSKQQGGFNRLLLSPPPSTQTLLIVDSLEMAPPSPSWMRNMRTRRIPSVKKRKMARSLPSRLSVIEKVFTQAASDLSRTVEEVKEGHRRLTSRMRISECLVNLKAASERSAKIKKFRESIQSKFKQKQQRKRHLSFRDLHGDFGMTLFDPLSMEVFEPSWHDDEGDLVPPEPVHYPVDMEEESVQIMKTCPRILTPSMIQQLVDKGLPSAVRTMTWRRCYASNRDGDAFLTMLNKTHDFKHTLLVVETTKGEVVGGFAAAPWDRKTGYGTSFFGNGQSFLFSDQKETRVAVEETPEAGESANDKNTKNDLPLSIYKWTGNNNYCQICDADEGQIAMGGGGSFGLILSNNFTRGTTGRCSTFNNPPLVAGDTFEVLNLEMYGFISMAQRHQSMLSGIQADNELTASQRDGIVKQSLLQDRDDYCLS